MPHASVKSPISPLPLLASLSHVRSGDVGTPVHVPVDPAAVLVVNVEVEVEEEVETEVGIKLELELELDAVELETTGGAATLFAAKLVFGAF